MRLTTLINGTLVGIVVFSLASGVIGYLWAKELSRKFYLAEAAFQLEDRLLALQQSFSVYRQSADQIDADLAAARLDETFGSVEELAISGLGEAPYDMLAGAITHYGEAFELYEASRMAKSDALARLRSAAEGLEATIRHQVSQLTDRDRAATAFAQVIEKRQEQVLRVSRLYIGALVDISRMRQAADVYVGSPTEGPARTVMSAIQRIDTAFAEIAREDPRLAENRRFKNLLRWHQTYTKIFTGLREIQDSRQFAQFANRLGQTAVPLQAEADRLLSEVELATQQTVRAANRERAELTETRQRSEAIASLSGTLAQTTLVARITPGIATGRAPLIEPAMRSVLSRLRLHAAELVRLAESETLEAELGRAIDRLDDAWASVERATAAQFRQDQAMTAATAEAVDIVAAIISDITRDVDAALRNLLTAIGVIAASAVVLGGIAMIVAYRRISRPLELLTSAIRRLTSGELQTPVPKFRSAAELIELAEAAEVLRQTSISRADLAAELERRAYTDELTGLPNRAQLGISVGRIIAAGKSTPFALAFIDVNKFKQINDYYGHSIGDQLLIEVSRRIQSAISDMDVLGRISGDEFLAVLRFTGGREGLDLVLDRILDALEPEMSLSGHEMHATVSIGTSVYPQDGSDYETLRRHADSAMYRAKMSGGSNIMHFDTSMSEELTARMDLEKRLRRAIRDYRFLPVFQPKVRLDDGKVTGFETLARWVDEDDRIRSPGEFIEVASELGLLDEVSEIIFSKTMDSVRILDEAFGNETCIALNISAAQAKDEVFVGRLIRRLQRRNLAKRVILELTEDAMLDATQFRQRVQPMIRDAGIQLSIDDFGTGYSSLSVLASLEANELKIDRSFVSFVDRDEKKQRILKTIVNFASASGLTTVAEGVEREEELRFLIEQTAVDSIQGYYISKPAMAEALAEMAPGLVLEQNRGSFGPGAIGVAG